MKSPGNNEKFEIRDIRKSPFLWISQNSFNKLKKMTAVDLKVYCYLAAKANNESQQTWGSAAHISRELQMSERYVFQALSSLKKAKLIKVIPPSESGFKVNNYFLVE